MKTGKRIAVECSEDSTVGDVKAIIQDKEGMPPDQQYLVFAGQLLEDERTISTCNIKSGSLVDLVLSPRAGKLLG